jgi:hypothetical protein
MESSSASLSAPFFKTCDRWKEFTFMEIELLLLFHFWPFAHIGTINFIISLNWHKHGASRFLKDPLTTTGRFKVNLSTARCRLVPVTRLDVFHLYLPSYTLQYWEDDPLNQQLFHISADTKQPKTRKNNFFFLNLSSRFSWVTSPFHAKIICFPFNLSRFKCGNSWRNKRVKCNNRRWLLTCEGRCKKLTTSGNPAPY